MANETVIRTIVIRGTAEGVQQTTDQLNKLAAANESVAVATEKTARAQLSAEKAFERVRKTNDLQFRQQQETAKTLEVLNRARAQNIGTDEQHARVLQGLASRHEAVNRAQKSLVDSTKLTRYEMINLSRQVQDVFVGLTSGQSPLTVIAQQGTQMADVFAASQVTLRGFFSQALGWAGRFATSTAGVVTGITAIGGAILYLRESFNASQRDIDRALAGVGRASGVTRDQINAIAQSAASGTALTIGEAREAATAFAATGRIYGDNVLIATKLTKDFARAAGIDTADAVKELATALADPTRGAIRLNESLGFLDGRTLQYIRTLQIQNREQEAQRALMEAASPVIRKQAEHISELAKAWDRLKQGAAAAAEFVGGGAQTNEQRLADLQKQLQSAQSAPAAKLPSWLGGGNEAVIRSIREEIERLQQTMRETSTAFNEARLDKWSMDADNAVRSTLPMIQQLEKLEEKLQDIARAKSAANVANLTGMAAMGAAEDPEAVTKRQAFADQNAIVEKILQSQKILLTEQVDLVGRQAMEVLRLAETWPGITIETARVLEAQQGQLNIASAVTAQEKLRAQEVARIRELISEQVPVNEAIARAANERKIAEAQINSQARLALMSLQDQHKVSTAVTGVERIRAQAAATYNNLIRQGVNSAQASAIAVQEMANAYAQVNANAQATLLTLRDQEAVAGAITGAEKIQAEAAATYNRLRREGVEHALALAVAEQQVTNAIAAANARVAEQVHQIEQQIELIAARNAGIEGSVRAEQAYVNAIRSGASEQAAEDLRDATRRLADAQDPSMHMPKRGTFEIPTSTEALEREYGPGGFEQTGKTGHFSDPFFRAIGIPTAEGLRNIVNEMLRRGDSLEAAIEALRQEALYPRGGGASTPDLVRNVENLIRDLYMRRTTEVGPGSERSFLEQELARLRAEPRTLERDDTMEQLNDRLRELTEATEDLNATMAGLSDLYTTDPRLSHIGFRADSGVLEYDPFAQPMGQPTAPPAPTPVPVPVPVPVPPGTNTPWHWLGGNQMAMGGIMTPWGPVPLDRYNLGGWTSGTVAFSDSSSWGGHTAGGTTGGVANAPRAALIGEGASPEAYVPLPDGRSIPVRVDLTQWMDRVQAPPGYVAPTAEQPIINIHAPITINSSGPANDNAAMRKTAFQLGQQMAGAISNATRRR